MHHKQKHHLVLTSFPPGASTSVPPPLRARLARLAGVGAMTEVKVSDRPMTMQGRAGQGLPRRLGPGKRLWRKNLGEAFCTEMRFVICELFGPKCVMPIQDLGTLWAQ